MYCTEDDVLQRINQISIKSGVDVSTFIADAESDIHMAAVTLYVVPFSTKDGLSAVASGMVSDVLRDVTARRAAGKLILSTSVAQENDNVHAFADEMLGSTEGFLKRLRKKEQVLPGLTLDEDKSDDFSRKISIQHSSPDGQDDATDSSSFFNRPYDEIGDKNERITGGPIPPS